MISLLNHNPFSQLHLPEPNLPFKPEVILAGDKENSTIARIIKTISTLRDESTVQKIERSTCGAVFIRDSMVLRLDGTVAIPCLLNQNDEMLLTLSNSTNIACSFLPPSSFHLMTETKEDLGLGGYGGTKSFYLTAKAIVENLKLESIVQKTFIEGGNVFLFQKDNKNYALVGEVSLALSLFLLEITNELVDTLSNKHTKPSIYAYYLARNQEIKNKYIKKHPWQNFSDYLKNLKTPLKDEDKESLYERAQLWEERLDQTKQLMGQDLQVSIENLIFIPQISFHIDMDLVVTPFKKILIHKEKKAIDLLEKLQKEDGLRTGEKDFFNHLLDNAKQNLSNDEVVKSIKTILRKHDLTTKTLPLKFQTDQGGVALNLVNGIFLKAQRREKNAEIKQRRILPEYTFITTGISYEFETRVHQLAIEMLIENLNDEVSVETVPSLSRFIYKYFGGVRCLTFETHSNTW